MELLLTRRLTIIYQLIHTQRIEFIKQIFDDIISYLNKITVETRKTDGMHVLTIICEELACLNTLRLFDHLILRNHPIFNYIKQTFKMLLIKSTHLPMISMTKQEEDCFNATSYFMTQLCLYQNEPLELFYGKVPTEIPKVTEKLNLRDDRFIETDRRSDELMEKPNLKTARLPVTAPKARPIEQREPDITKVKGLKKFSFEILQIENESEVECRTTRPNSIILSVKRYTDLFLTKSVFDIFVRAIDDLSRNEYPPYHVKYKVIDRLVRLSSHLNIIHALLNSILKCLRSRYYRQAFETIEINQIRLSPKQLLFIRECPQFLIQHNLLQQDKIAGVVSKAMVEVTKPIFDKHFSATDVPIDSNENGDRRIAMQALSCHIELLYHLSLTSAGRQHFTQSSVMTQLLLLLQQDALISTAQLNKHLFNTDVAIVAYSLMLLMNLAYEQHTFSMLRKTNLKDISAQLKSAKDNTIQFACQILITIFNKETINEDHEPMKLKDAYNTFLEKALVEQKEEKRVDVTKNIKGKEIKVKYKFATESFLKRLIKDIKDISTKEYDPNASKYKEVVRRIHVCTKQETNDVESLLDPISTCLTSDKYINCYQKIELQPAKAAARTAQTNYHLASKHIFYICECPEFLMRHAYKRQKEITTKLWEIMAEKTQIIFKEHLPVLIGTDDSAGNENMKNARIEALSSHIKLLSHLALTSSVRQDFLTKPIIDQMFLILENDTLLDRHGRINHNKLGVVGQALILLYNLALNKKILSILKTKNLFNICLKFRSENDKIIHFASQTLAVMLNEKIVENLSEPLALSKTYIEYIDKSAKEPKQPYQGVKLRGLLQNLKVLIPNDTIQENIVEEKQGISSIAKCVVVCPPDLQGHSDKQTGSSLQKIQYYALEIICDLLRSIYGSIASKKLKSNDVFVDCILTLRDGTLTEPKKLAGHIIWKLGNEKQIRSEYAGKEKGKVQDGEQDDNISIIDGQLPTDSQWDDSIPFDLLISYSSGVNDTNICHKIYHRLIANQIRVYIEKAGKHRLEIIQKAIAQKKPILVCLSNEYRKSKVCMAEVEYAFKHKSPIIVALVDGKYKSKGWLLHLVSGKPVVDFTQKSFFNDAVLKLISELEMIKASD